MRRLLRPLFGAAIATLAAQCVDPSLSAPKPITSLPRQLTGAEHALIAVDNRFAFSLFGEIARDASPDANLFISPLSAAMALGMAYNGAAGVTQADMQRTLDLTGMTLDDVNQSYRSLIELLRGLDPQVGFTLANSVWYRQSLAISPGFVNAVRTYFDAPAQGLDFRSPTAAATINSWVDTQTHGKIPAIVPDPLPSDAMAYLINAIYFKAAWTTQFDKSLTQPGPFTLRSGATTSVPMMNHAGTVPVSVLFDGNVSVVDLAYGGGAFSMTIVLPRAVAGLDSVTQGLTEERWNAWIAALQSGKVNLSLPKFTLSYQPDMNGVLRALGMASAYCDSPSVDFSMMGPGLCISDVRHKATVDVDEEGTEAAAATSVAIGPTSLPPFVLVNRPFLFVIREKLSGTILFLGRVMNPAPS